MSRYSNCSSNRFFMPMRSAFQFGLAAFLTLSAACTKVPELEPHIAHIEIEDQIDQASVIAVGVVEKEYLIRKIVDADGDEIGLFSVDVRLEGVLKGQLDKGTAETGHFVFYYYQVYGAWNGPSPNFIYPGDRDIFYLIRDAGVLRATTDAYLSHTRLKSGKHAVSRVPDDQVHEAIAQLILLPGAEPDTGYLSLDGENTGLAMDLVGVDRVREMLGGLLDDPDGRNRARACLHLAEPQSPLSDPSCLPKIIADPQTSPDDLERPRGLMLETLASP